MKTFVVWVNGIMTFIEANSLEEAMHIAREQENS